MKLSLKIILVILLIVGGIFMLNRYGSFNSLKYEKYSSKDQELNITMDYISGWSYKENRGPSGSYAQVLFIEPKQEEGIKANIVLTVKSRSRVKFEPPTIETMAQDLTTKRLKLKDAKALSKSKMRLLNTEAKDIQLAYKTLDKLYSVDAKLIPARERIVIFKKDDKFYTLRYMNKEQEFKKFERAFSHCIKTLRIK